MNVTDACNSIQDDLFLTFFKPQISDEELRKILFSVPPIQQLEDCILYAKKKCLDASEKKGTRYKVELREPVFEWMSVTHQEAIYYFERILELKKKEGEK